MARGHQTNKNANCLCAWTGPRRPSRAGTPDSDDSAAGKPNRSEVTACVGYRVVLRVGTRGVFAGRRARGFFGTRTTFTQAVAEFILAVVAVAAVGKLRYGKHVFGVRRRQRGPHFRDTVPLPHRIHTESWQWTLSPLPLPTLWATAQTSLWLEPRIEFCCVQSASPLRAHIIYTHARTTADGQGVARRDEGFLVTNVVEPRGLLLLLRTRSERGRVEIAGPPTAPSPRAAAQLTGIGFSKR